MLFIRQRCAARVAAAILLSLCIAGLTACHKGSIAGGKGSGSSSGGSSSPQEYSISGNITGLTASGLVLQLNGGNNLTVLPGSTSFTFPTTVAHGLPYDVTVLLQPFSQQCTITNGVGTTNGSNVSNVSISCADLHWPGTRHYGTSSYDVGNAISVDSSGNVIVAGCSASALQYHHSSYLNTCDTVGGSADGVVQKFSPDGVLQWTRQISNSVTVEVNAVVVDSSQNIYLAGFVYGSLDGQMPFGGKDVFLIKYDPSGNKLWTYQFGTFTSDQGNALAIDTSGNIYVAGTTFGNLDGNSVGNNYEVFVARFNATSVASSTTPPSAATWLVQFGTNAADFGLGVAADGSGNVFVSGVTLGTLGNSAYGSEDVFVAKLDASNGSRSWTQQIGDSGYDYNSGVAVDAGGNVYIAGYTSGFAGVGNLYDLFVASYDTNGTQRWVQQLVSVGHDYTMGIAIAGNNVYVTGFTAGDFDGNSNADPSYNTTDIFVIQYDTSGNKQWARTIGTTADDRSYAIATDSGGNAYITGYTLDSLDGGTNQGASDAFILKYNSAGIKQ